MTMWYATSVGLLKSPFSMPVEMGEIRGIESVTEIVRQSTKKATLEAFARSLRRKKTGRARTRVRTNQTLNCLEELADADDRHSESQEEQGPGAESRHGGADLLNRGRDGRRVVRGD